jgi:integrase
MLTSVFGEELLKLLLPQVAPRTFSIYRLSLLKWIELMGDTDISSISVQNVELWKNKALLNISPVTTSIYFRALKTLWNKALRMGLITGESPFSKVSGVKIPAKNPEWITQEDHEKILKCVKGSGLKNRASLRRLFTFLFHTGMRSNEALSLRVEDIDLKGKVALVRATKTNTIRGIPLNATAFHAISREIEMRELISGKIWNFTHSGATHSFLHAKRAAKINKGVTFYSYRHSFATRLLRKGVPIPNVAKLLGDRIDTVMKYYAAFDTEQLRAGVDTLD